MIRPAWFEFDLVVGDVGDGFVLGAGKKRIIWITDGWILSLIDAYHYTMNYHLNRIKIVQSPLCSCGYNESVTELSSDRTFS